MFGVFFRIMPGQDDWHFDPGCHDWPEQHFIEWPCPPVGGQMCQKCCDRVGFVPGLSDGRFPGDALNHVTQADFFAPMNV